MRSLTVACMLLESMLLVIWFVYEHVCDREYTIYFAGREKGIVGSAVVVILKPLWVFYFIVYS